MSNYSMTIQEMSENPLCSVFPKSYPFYCHDEKTRLEFEEKFIQKFFYREIGYESPYQFNQRLYSLFLIRMPYYEQLYQTEWNRVRTVEQMMTSKNLKETTEHKQSIEGSNESESNATSSNIQSDSMNQSSTSSGTNTTSSNGTSSSSSSSHEKQSSLADGVAQASLTDGYLTAVGESSNTTSGESNNSTNISINSNDKSNTTNNSQGTAEQNGKTSGSNKQELTETTTFSSVGDIGIQTPAYAITEWRKIIINLDEMILNECESLFLKIY